MSADPACRAPVPPEGAVPRTCVPFAHVPAVPAVMVPYVPVPVPSGLPVLSVAGILPDRTGNVDVTRFLEEWAAVSLSGKADKAVPLAAGNLASLDASGNLSDSGATPASIARSAVEAVVANAPGTMDTLKEIADILGSPQQSGTVLKRISDLETGKADSSSLARVATSGSYDDLSGKPAIPAPVAVDATLSTQGAAADAKAVGDALRSEFTEWVFSGDGYDAGHTYTVVIDPSEEEGDYDYMLYDNGTYVDLVTVATDSVLVVYFSTGITATRHFATPTKTSQLTNDGAPNGGGTPYATTGQIPSASTATPQMDGTASPGSSAAYSRGDHVHPSDTGKLDGAAAYPAWSAGVYSVGTVRSYNGRLYKLASQVVNQSVPPDSAPWWEETTIADLKQDALSQSQLAAVNSGVTSEKVATWDDYAAQIAAKASLADLPYRLVEPGKWEFSGKPDGYSFGNVIFTDGAYYCSFEREGFGDITYEGSGSESDLVVELYSELATPSHITATRASLPGHLCDRAGNRVVVSGATTLTLPALVNAGKSRDLLVRLTVSADATVTFSAPTGETITWDDAGSPTATYEAGTHLIRFTEVATSVFHFTDLGAGGSIDPAVLNGKLEATSAAPAFDPTKTYSEGEYVTYEGVLYECSTAVTTAGAWKGSTNWTATDMTSPDATLDLMADGRLRLVSADGDVLWMQGYALASASSVTLSCDKVNFHVFASGTTTATFTMPTAPVGKVGDFVLDVDNTANASASVTATLTGAGTAFDVFTPKGVNLSTDILTFAGGEQCELYFTMTAFGTAAKPAWKVVKQIVEKQEFGS